jgi:hypothetical protein
MNFRIKLCVLAALVLVSTFAMGGAIVSSPPGTPASGIVISNTSDGGLPVNTSMLVDSRVIAYSVPTDGGCITPPSVPQRKSVQIHNHSTTAQLCVGFGSSCPVWGGNCFIVQARGAGISAPPGYWAGNEGGAIVINIIANGTGSADIAFSEGW